jgi:hypothetical protein
MCVWVWHMWMITCIEYIMTVCPSPVMHSLKNWRWGQTPQKKPSYAYRQAQDHSVYHLMWHLRTMTLYMWSCIKVTRKVNIDTRAHTNTHIRCVRALTHTHTNTNRRIRIFPWRGRMVLQTPPTRQEEAELLAHSLVHTYGACRRGAYGSTSSEWLCMQYVYLVFGVPCWPKWRAFGSFRGFCGCT